MKKIIHFRNTLKNFTQILLTKGFIIIFIFSLILYFLLYPNFKGFEGFFTLAIYSCCLILLPIAFLFTFVKLLIDLIIICKYGKKVQAKVVNIKYRFSSKGLSNYTLSLEFEHESNTLIKPLFKSSFLLSYSKFTQKYFGKKYFVYYTDKLPDRVFKYPLIKEFFILFIAFVIAILFIFISIHEIAIYFMMFNII